MPDGLASPDRPGEWIVRDVNAHRSSLFFSYETWHDAHATVWACLMIDAENADNQTATGVIAHYLNELSKAVVDKPITVGSYTIERLET